VLLMRVPEGGRVVTLARTPRDDAEPAAEPVDDGSADEGADAQPEADSEPEKPGEP
jgi:hypothetical protein